MQNDDLDHARAVIRAEADVLRRLAEHLDERIIAAVELCEAATGRVVVCGLGKSGHAARKISATLSSTNTPSAFLHATEALHGDLGGLQSGDVLIAITKSGETPEVVQVAAIARERNIPVVAITNETGSALAAASTVLLPLMVEAEAGPDDLAPTSSVVATLALGDAIALTLMHRRGDGAAAFAAHHPGGSLGKRLLGGGQ
jgi:arabinose-5-phosphate isomerase